MLAKDNADCVVSTRERAFLTSDVHNPRSNHILFPRSNHDIEVRNSHYTGVYSNRIHSIRAPVEHSKEMSNPDRRHHMEQWGQLHILPITLKQLRSLLFSLGVPPSLSWAQRHIIRNILSG